MDEPIPPASLKGTASFLGDLVKQVRLVWRLLRDGRVPGWVKLIPFAGAIYLISPIDLIPDLMLPGLGELDDLAVILISLRMFVELAPPGIVREHLEDLIGWRRRVHPDDDPSIPYIDASYHILDKDRE